MGGWNVNGRDGTKVADPKQMMGMFIAEVFEKAKELQEMLDRDPLLFEQVEQEAKELAADSADLIRRLPPEAQKQAAAILRIGK